MVFDPHDLSGECLQHFVLLIGGELSSANFHVLSVILADRLDNLLGVLLFEVLLVPLALELVELIAVVPQGEPQLELLLELLHDRDLRSFVAKDLLVGVEVVDLTLSALKPFLYLL